MEKSVVLMVPATILAFLQTSGSVFSGSGGIYDQSFIVDLQLIEVHLGQMEMIGAVIPSQRHFMGICFTKLFQGDMVLFQQLSC